MCGERGAQKGTLNQKVKKEQRGGERVGERGKKGGRDREKKRGGGGVYIDCDHRTEMCRKNSPGPKYPLASGFPLLMSPRWPPKPL